MFMGFIGLYSKHDWGGGVLSKSDKRAYILDRLLIRVWHFSRCETLSKKYSAHQEQGELMTLSLSSSFSTLLSGNVVL